MYNCFEFDFQVKKTVVFICLLVSFLGTFGQSMVDSAITIPMVGISYAYQIPGGDMSRRFGNNSSIGGKFAIKLKSNAYIELKANYIFGGKVKETDVLRNIRTPAGGIIERGGELTNPLITESGYDFFILGGYIFHIFGPNPNSGILIAGGPGFLQHQLIIDYRNAQIPQLSKEYRRGYDRLTNGFALNQFIGYTHFAKNRLINFYLGFDFTQAWTKNRRGYNYDEMGLNEGSRFDMLTGFRIGWLLALHRRAPEKFYYH